MERKGNPLVNKGQHSTSGLLLLGMKVLGLKYRRYVVVQAGLQLPVPPRSVPLSRVRECSIQSFRYF